MMSRKRGSIGGAFYALIALIFAFGFFYPVYFTLISSFKNNNEIWNTMFSLPSSIEWNNFVSSIYEIKILRSVGNSFIFSFGATLIVILAVTMASYVISRRTLKGARGLRLFYLIGLMIPAYGMLVPVVRMFTTLGFRDMYVPMMILYAGVNFPIAFFIIINYMDGISREIDEAASIDGCGLFGTVFKVLFPICVPGVSTAGIITFLAVYNELIFSNTLLQKKSMQTISVTLLGLRGERFSSWGPMFACIVLSIIPILIIYILFQNKVESGMTAGAVKG